MSRKRGKIRFTFEIVVAILLLAVLAWFAWKLAGGALPDDMRGEGRALWQRVTSTLEDAAQRVIKPAPQEAPGNAAVTTQIGSIQVFFGPCDPSDPSGIDDHLIQLLHSAKRTVFAAFYELESIEVAQALIARHENGVDVKLVTDSDYAGRDALRMCRDAGIFVAQDNRSAFMHNKFCVVDGQWVWTGSTNITGNGFYRNNNNSLLIASPLLADNYTIEFAEMFMDTFFGIKSPRNTPYPELMAGQIRIECYFAPEDGVEQELLEEIGAAQQSIDVMAFSFTSKPIAEAMVARIGQGVKVRALFETRNAGSQYSRDDFLAANGARVYMDTNPNAMHHKVIVIDNATVATGSYNFSAAAESSNDENVLIVHSSEVAQIYTEEFERLTSQ